MTEEELKGYEQCKQDFQDGKTTVFGMKVDELAALRRNYTKQKEINKEQVDEAETLRNIIAAKEIEIAKLQADISKCEETIDRQHEDIEDVNGELEQRSIHYWTKLGKINQWFITNVKDGDNVFKELIK